MHHALSIKHFAKSFGVLSVFEDISLSVDKQEFVSIIGPSGCGKSTLFHILAGVDKATSGELFLDKKKITDSRGKFGYMPQDASLLPWKTVLENVMIGPRISGLAKTKAQEKATELLEKFNLQNFTNHYPATLSGGMQQRVALLRTVLFNPSFLLLDEPFGSLDALTRQDAQLWLLEVFKEFRSSVLFITHDIQEAILLSDRIYVFSSRPAKIMKEVPVNLPRPRKLTDLTSPRAVALEKQLFSLLKQTKK
ncbi:MAG TPA: ABC transporter ATP-binding protein [Candidatus Acidoferrales bacterium]|nr:ABC transporter ATP-binding protein [Candidatus Acidoferrales bacterium]